MELAGSGLVEVTLATVEETRAEVTAEEAMVEVAAAEAVESDLIFEPVTEPRGIR